MSHESLLRLGCFLGVFVVMAAWEMGARRRPHSASIPLRWVWNLGLAVADTAFLQFLGGLVFAGLAVGMAHWAQERGWGVFNVVAVPDAVAFLLSFLALDLAIYFQHLLSHKVPVLWRLHKVHHSDRDLDVTSALRFHPLEIMLSMAYKMAWVAGLGAPPTAVMAFEVVLNGMALFNHGNVRMPASLDRLLRCLVVTPDMHRVHHSDRQKETDSNYGFNLSWWDRIFSSYRPAPEAGHLGMTLGLREYPNPRQLHLGYLLFMPFLSTPASTPTSVPPDTEE